MNKQVFYATMFCAFACAAGCSKSSSSTPDVVATVDGVPISADDFHKFLERMPTIKVQTAQGPQDAKPAQLPGFQVIQKLVEQKLLLEIAKDEGVSPTDKEVEDAITFHRNLQPDFVTGLQREGLTMQDIRDSIRLDLARFKIMTRGITVSQAETQQFIKEHPKQFSTPPSANLLWIVADDAHKKMADQELQSGTPFSAVALHDSNLDLLARKFNGKYHNQTREVTLISEMPPVLQDLVKSTPELKATNWIQDQTRWVKFFVQSKSDSKLVPMNQYKIEAVQQALMLQKGGKAKQEELQKQMLAKLRSAKVQMGIPVYSDLWKQQQDDLAQFMAAQQPTSGGSPTTSSAPPAKPKH